MDRIDKVADAVATALKGFVARALTPIAERLSAVESRQPEKGEPGTNGTNGIDGTNGKDGLNGKDAEVDYARIETTLEARFRALIDAGITKAVAELPKPLDGRDGRDVSAEDVALLVRAAVAELPKPQDGRDGKDGLIVEGFDFAINGRVATVTLQCTNGQTITKSARMDIPQYTGIFRSGQKSEKNDMTTHSGSVWIAKCDTENAPPHSDWVLVVKKGEKGADVYQVAKRNGFEGTEQEWLEEVMGRA